MTTPPIKSTPPPMAERRPAIDTFLNLFRLPPNIANHTATPKVLLLAIALVWGLLLTSGDDFDPANFVVGEIAPRTVRSTSKLALEDPEATDQARQAAMDAVLPIVDHLENLPARLQERVAVAFEAMRKRENYSEELKNQIEKTLGVPLASEQVESLFDVRNDLRFERTLKDAVGLIGQVRIAADPNKWNAAYPNGIELRTSGNKQGTTSILTPDTYRTILTVEEAKKLIEDQIWSRHREVPYPQRKLISSLLGMLIQPNLLPNPIETEKARSAARESVKPVYFQLKAGEVIVRSGERITPAQVKQLVGLRQEQSRYQEFMEILAKIGLLLVAVFILMPYERRSGWRNLGHPQDLLFTLLATSTVLIIIQAGRNFTDPFMTAVPDLPRESILLLMPFATVGMIFRLFFRPKIAFRVAVLFAFACALFVEPVMLILPYSLLGSAAGIHVLQHSKRRSQFYQAGFTIGLVQSGVWLAYMAIEPSAAGTEMLKALPLAFVGGLLASVLASTLMPLCEWIGRYVSEVRLLELAQDDQPLLKWLHLNAPGTFNHSISVARLAETAAERIGADELLTRVGAYYHDIGKGYWPQYFVENQRADNPHDKLKPQLSSRVIIAHVTHGAELARKNNLPEVIINFIQEHHGTSRVEYFFRQAQEQGSSKEDPNDDTSYRYPGPRPHSKETALVMLADVVESATRTLENPTQDRIAAFVTRLVEKVYADDQLARSPLTLKDLSVAKAAFTDVLTGMYHHRIDYPHALKPGKTTGEASQTG